jgi:hypothetical protein
MPATKDQADKIITLLTSIDARLSAGAVTTKSDTMQVTQAQLFLAIFVKGYPAHAPYGVPIVVLSADDVKLWQNVSGMATQSPSPVPPTVTLFLTRKDKDAAKMTVALLQQHFPGSTANPIRIGLDPANEKGVIVSAPTQADLDAIKAFIDAWDKQPK